MGNQNPLIKPAKKELTNLKKRLARAEAEYNEYMGVSDVLFSIHKEFASIVESKETGEAVIAKLEKLQQRRDKANRILKKDAMNILDKITKIQIEYDRLATELSRLEFRQSMRTD